MINIVIPDVPVSDSAKMMMFLSNVKELLETFNGMRDPQNQVYTAATLSSNDLISTGAISSPFTTYTYMSPPYLLVVTATAWSHQLTWVNPSALILDGVEVWAHTVDDVSLATRIAKVGRQTNKFERLNFDVDSDWYYWIRAVSYVGKYSVWVPATTVGGYEVSHHDSISERVDAVMEALIGASPATYDALVVYTAGQHVSWTDADGNIKRYERTSFSPGAAGQSPALIAYWARDGILMDGDIAGVPSVGIDGGLICDESITVNAIDLTGITVGDGTGDTIAIGTGVIESDDLTAAAKLLILNSNQAWSDISGVGLPEDSATRNLIYNQAGTPTGSTGAIWMDTNTDPPLLKFWSGGAWVTGATNDIEWRHASNITRIDGGKIYTGSLASGAYAASSITADKLNVSALSSISANCGTITSGTLQSTDTQFTLTLGATGSLVVTDTLGVERVRLGYISG